MRGKYCKELWKYPLSVWKKTQKYNCLKVNLSEYEIFVYSSLPCLKILSSFIPHIKIVFFFLESLFPISKSCISKPQDYIETWSYLCL